MLMLPANLENIEEFRTFHFEFWKLMAIIESVKWRIWIEMTGRSEMRLIIINSHT